MCNCANIVHLVQVIFASGHEDKAGALLRKDLCNLSTDASAGTGDERPFTSK